MPVLHLWNIQTTSQPAKSEDTTAYMYVQNLFIMNSATIFKSLKFTMYYCEVIKVHVYTKVGLVVGDNNNCMQVDCGSAHCCGCAAYGSLAMAVC